MERGHYLVLGTAVVSGFSIFMNKWAVTGLNPYFFTFAKNIIVALFLFSMIIFMREFKSLKELKIKQWLQLMTIGLIGGSIPFLMFFKGLQMASAATAGFIHKTLFIYVAVLAAIFLKEKISKGLFLGAILLLAGNFLLLKFTWNFSNGTGTLLIFLATLFWAAENVLSKHVLNTLTSRIVAGGRMFFGSLFILIFLSATGHINQITNLSLAHFQWILFTSILLLLYVTTWYEGLRTINVSIATCILALGSVITTILDLAFFQNPVIPTQIIGMILLFLGTILAINSSTNIIKATT